MIPVKDNIPREGFPFVTTIAISVLVLAYLFSNNHRGLLPLLADILFLGLLGPSVEGALGRVGFACLCALLGLLTLMVRSLAGIGSPSAVLLGALIVTVTVLGVYLLLFPRARVLTLVAIPFFTTLIEIPAALLIGCWLALEIFFAAEGLA